MNTYTITYTDGNETKTDTVQGASAEYDENRHQVIVRDADGGIVALQGSVSGLRVNA